LSLKKTGGYGAEAVALHRPSQRPANFVSAVTPVAKAQPRSPTASARPSFANLLDSNASGAYRWFGVRAMPKLVPPRLALANSLAATLPIEPQINDSGHE
jgi:hypothetical protein